MNGVEAAIRIVSLVLGAALAGGSLYLVYLAYVRPQKDGNDSGCLSFIAAAIAMVLAIGMVLAGVAGPEAAVRWFS